MRWIWIPILFLMLSSPCHAQSKSPPVPIRIEQNAMVGFDKCEVGKTLSEIVDLAFKKVRPIQKEEGVLTYPAESEFYGIPVKELKIGVCDDQSRSCGWAAFIGFTLDMPLEAAREKLRQSTGKDFTQEVRDFGSQRTLRPVLFKAGVPARCIVFCDPGGL